MAAGVQYCFIRGGLLCKPCLDECSQDRVLTVAAVASVHCKQLYVERQLRNATETRHPMLLTKRRAIYNFSNTGQLK